MPCVYILNHPHLPTSRNHRFFIEKFANGFKMHNFDVLEITDVSEIIENGFVFISNEGLEHAENTSALVQHYHHHQPWFLKILVRILKFLKIKNIISHFFQYKNHKKAFAVLKELSKKEQIIVFAWFFNHHLDILEQLSIKYILFGEHYWKEPVTENARHFFNLYSHPKCLPVDFAANIHPENIQIPEYKPLLLSYIGNRTYKPSYLQLFENDPRCKIVRTPPYIHEEDRIKIISESQINLGFHSDDNIRNHVVVERVYEALAYGTICVTDHPDAEQITNGAAIFVKNEQELKSIVEILQSNPQKRKEHVQKGIDFIRTKGTYFHQAQYFLDFAKRLYGITW